VEESPEGVEPNCRGELAGYWLRNCQKKDGCSFIQYRQGGPKTAAYRFVKQLSAVCNDPVDAKSQGGRASMAYNETSHYMYFLTGVGTNLYRMQVQTGVETFMGPLPLGHSYILNLGTTGNRIILWTVDEAYEANVNTIPVVWTKISTLRNFGRPRATSIIMLNPKNVSQWYVSSFDSDDILPAIWTVQQSPLQVLSQQILPPQYFDDMPRQMFYSKQLGRVVATNGTNGLHSLAVGPGTDGAAKFIANVNPGSVAAAVYGDRIYGDQYFSANSSQMTSTQLSTGKRLWYSPVDGTAFFGNFVYIN